MCSKMDTSDYYKDVFGVDEQVMPCFPNAEYFTNVINAESKYDRVNALYGKRFAKPSSLIVIHPSVESMKVYGNI